MRRVSPPQIPVLKKMNSKFRKLLVCKILQITCVIKSFIPARNVPERVEVPNKTAQNPTNKRGGVRKPIRIPLL
jgi:hypothetical protein